MPSFVADEGIYTDLDQAEYEGLYTMTVYPVHSSGLMYAKFDVISFSIIIKINCDDVVI